MALAEFHLNANNVLGRMNTFIAIIPDKGKGPFPVLYLLHGLSDDQSAWTRRTLIESMVSDLPLIVVMPNGDRGHYSDSKTVPPNSYETFMIQNLIPFVDNTLKTIPKGSKRMVAGLSMGGYGALKLALKYPDLFAGGLSFSGAFNFGNTNKHKEPRKTKELQAIYGKKIDGKDDIFELAKGVNRKNLPAIHFDCGTEDFCLDWNQKLHQHLKKINFPHQYEEHPGQHNWNYWNNGLLRMIPWILDTLKIKANFDRNNFKLC